MTVYRLDTGTRRIARAVPLRSISSHPSGRAIIPSEVPVSRRISGDFDVMHRNRTLSSAGEISGRRRPAMPENFHKMCGKLCEKRIFDRPNSLKSDRFSTCLLKGCAMRPAARQTDGVAREVAAFRFMQRLANICDGSFLCQRKRHARNIVSRPPDRGRNRSGSKQAQAAGRGIILPTATR